MNGFREQYEKYRSDFETALEKYCSTMSFPSPLTDSMRYSLLCGGKRIRPVLFFAALDLFRLDYTNEYGLALALECIHTYSLIHDDLPAMDNDDFRRGKPSNHKLFGEANAILAGDGLLSCACSLLLRESGRSEAHRKAAVDLMDAAGAGGMIAGQSMDLRYTGKTAGKEELFSIYENKTAKLIAAPLVMAAVLADTHIRTMRNFGINLGFLFQLTDDILDVKGESGTLGKTAGKDSAEDKLTCVKVFGLEQSERLADDYAQSCLNEIKEVENCGFFRELVRFVRERSY